MSLGEAFADLEETLEEAPDATDADGANRILGVLARLQREDLDDTEVAEAVIARASGWLEGRRAARRDRTEHLRGVLERYAEARRTADPKVKTIDLPNGKIRTRARAARAVYVDEAAALAYLVEHWPTTVKVSSSIDKAKAREAFAIVESGPHVFGKVADRITGEVVPGVEVEAAGITYTIELAR